MNIMFKKMLVISSLFIASLSAMEKESIIKKQDKRPMMRQNSFFSVKGDNNKHDSTNLSECCHEWCYICLPLYYLINCVVNTDESVFCVCCCAKGHDERIG